MGIGKKGEQLSGVTVLGHLTFVRQDARDIRVVFSTDNKGIGAKTHGFSTEAGLNGSKMAQASVKI
ncbi:hypothetical protein YZ82_07555 [Campylobacter hyointestinalis]|uniref:Uncharacterized protein n=1 Tax=Campylobacter hyointestinalis TaxID=198 RepID=A0A562X9Y7_CAMHY|nr:hypothetical protein [Campylobacter hyointestinalis]TWO18958.1 hypothetical protein YZ82_07555 [Campylobacter hyointestinalis]